MSRYKLWELKKQDIFSLFLGRDRVLADFGRIVRPRRLPLDRKPFPPLVSAAGSVAGGGSVGLLNVRPHRSRRRHVFLNWFLSSPVIIFAVIFNLFTFRFYILVNLVGKFMFGRLHRAIEVTIFFIRILPCAIKFFKICIP